MDDTISLETICRSCLRKYLLRTESSNWEAGLNTLQCWEMLMGSLHPGAPSPDLCQVETVVAIENCSQI